MAFLSLCEKRTPCRWYPLVTPQMIWWSTSSWSILSWERLRMTPVPRTTSPCLCSMARPSEIWPMSKASRAASSGCIRSWKAGGGEGLLSWPEGLEAPLLHSNMRFCRAVACVGLVRSRRLSLWNQELQLRDTWQRCTPGCIQPGSCWRKSLGPNWWQSSLLSPSSLNCSPLANEVRGTGPAASCLWTTKEGSHTADPVLGSFAEKRSTPSARMSASISETLTQTFSHLRKAPKSRATSCLPRVASPSPPHHCAMSVSTSASDAMGKSSCARMCSTSSMGNSRHLESSVMEHKLRRWRRAAMSCSRSFSWYAELSAVKL
mmetsp:Transcript_101518/g.302842  ORF Transcript_101518/g.302842 Transcript_101518/m.302842 type:complete len:319 (+) Transcript_101518:366-1322(+)